MVARPGQGRPQQSQVDLLSVWNAAPIRLVEDSPADGPYPAHVRGQAIGLERGQHAAAETPEGFAAVAGRAGKELGMDAGAVAEFVALTQEPMSAELLPRLLQLLNLPAEVAGLATGTVAAESLPGAVSADATGALAKIAERRYRH